MYLFVLTLMVGFTDPVSELISYLLCLVSDNVRSFVWKKAQLMTQQKIIP